MATCLSKWCRTKILDVCSRVFDVLSMQHTFLAPNLSHAESRNRILAHPRSITPSTPTPITLGFSPKCMRNRCFYSVTWMVVGYWNEHGSPRAPYGVPYVFLPRNSDEASTTHSASNFSKPSLTFRSTANPCAARLRLLSSYSSDPTTVGAVGICPISFEADARAPSMFPTKEAVVSLLLPALLNASILLLAS